MARILVMDDEEMLTQMLRELLEDAGHYALTSSNGVEGMALFEHEPADLVVVDIYMPKKGGLDVISELRESHPDVKIIAMTGYGRELLAKASQLGANRTFRKPFSTKVLLGAVDSLLASA